MYNAKSLISKKILITHCIYIFAQLKGAPLNTRGWSLKGDASVANVVNNDKSELLLCSTKGVSGAAFYTQPINLSLCSKWKAEFDFRMYDGSGADGLAFCFLDIPPTGFVTGAGLGIPLSANGLKICFTSISYCICRNIIICRKPIQLIIGTLS